MTTSEDEIVAWFERQSNLPRADFPIGIGDDMAEIRLSKSTSVFITTDMILDGVHFDLQKTTLKQVGYKAMAVNLSDCAAMATIPVAAVVAVALPKQFGKTHLKQLHSGITLAAKKFGCVLIGGDITSWRTDAPFAISVAMLSRKAENDPIKRSGAKVGDAICVTGSLGGSQLGRHLRFEPRVSEALQIARMAKVNAMIDISDGLSSDLNRICHYSAVGAVIDAEQIPLSRDAKRIEDPLASALHDGEDFELLFTLSKQQCKKLLQNWHKPVPITQIGRITDTKKMRIKMPDDRTIDLKVKGYNHLR